MSTSTRAAEARITIVGGGLAGAEAAWQAAQRGVPVALYEMRPTQQTPAHVTDRLAELVCSNSLGSNLQDRPLGLLKQELRVLGSLIVAAADDTSVPAGGALAVGREAFAEQVTARIEAHPLIEVCRQEVTSLPTEGIAILATGPLTSPRLSEEIRALTSDEFFYFYDAMAPIIALESIDLYKAFRASRYGKDAEPGTGGDYINCPMNQAEYDAFVEALLAAERIPLRDFEREDKRFFEACLPVEVIAERGHKALAFGPMRPVGLRDPHTGYRPYAVVQLRQDNLAATLYNMVGFQTNLRWGDQERVFRMIPGLQEAEFVRFGQMHRNTYVHSPNLLAPTMVYRGEAPGSSTLFFAGQITGTEGYVGSTASGYVAGLNAARAYKGQEPLVFPVTTMIGALCRYVTTPQKEFQPMKANYGLLPPLATRVRKKSERHLKLSERALRDLEAFMSEHGERKTAGLVEEQSA